MKTPWTFLALAGLVSVAALKADDQSAPSTPQNWLAILDYQYRASEAISHTDGTTGTYGRSRDGAEVIWQNPVQAYDLEYYRYTNNFGGNIAGTTRSYGDTTDLMLTGFKQTDWNEHYAVQVIYALESARETGESFSQGFRWGLGGAARWRPDAETDIALGVMVEDRFEAGLLAIPYVKAVWRPCRYAEIELRVTGLQNGLIARWFVTADHATTVDFTIAYETLTFELTPVYYGGRAVSIGEVPVRLGVTQFLEKSGTWFVRGAVECVPFSRQSFVHDSQTVEAFQAASTWGTSVRIGARF
jgi:hypothetical protein